MDLRRYTFGAREIRIFLSSAGTNYLWRAYNIIQSHIWDCKNMALSPPEREWKKGSAELLVLSLLKDQPRHGYDISKLIHIRSGGLLRFHVTSLYPLLHRLEEQGSIEGRWVEKAEQRRRRYYCLTPQGKKVLRSKQKSWKDFVAAISRLTGIEYA
jgi:transcriptional regulator